METDTSAEALERLAECVLVDRCCGKWRRELSRTFNALAAEKRRAREGVTDDDAAAWMFPSDLEDFEQAETNAWAYSIKMVRPGEETVPLFTRAALEAVWPDGYFIGGPHASAMVYDMADAENVIAALAKRTGDDEDDYTVTSLAAQEGRSRE